MESRTLPRAISTRYPGRVVARCPARAPAVGRAAATGGARRGGACGHSERALKSGGGSSSLLARRGGGCSTARLRWWLPSDLEIVAGGAWDVPRRAVDVPPGDGPAGAAGDGHTWA